MANNSAAPDQIVNALLTNKNLSNPHVVKALAGDVRSQIDANSYHNMVAIRESQTIQAANLKEIQDEYILGQKKNYVVNGAFGVGSFLLERSVTYGMAGAAATMGGSFLVATTGILAKAALDEVGDFVKQKSQELLNRNLATHFEAYRAQAGADSYQRLLNNPDPLSVRAEIESQLGLVMVPLDGLDAAAQNEVNRFYNKHMATVMTNGFSAVTSSLALQQSDIETNKRNIQAFGQTFTTYARETTEILAEITADQKSIKEELIQLEERADKTDDDVDYIQGYLFGKMSPTDQLNALHAGFFDGMPDEKKKSLEAQISLEKKRENFTKNVDKYLNGAQHIVAICENLGLSSDLVATMNTAVRVGDTAFKAFTAFSSGNILAGVSAVTEIFGFGGGRDIAGERHQEVMHALDTLYEQNAVISEQIVQLMEGQEQILENQKITYDAIISISEQIGKNHLEVMEKLQEIQHDVLYERQFFIDEFESRYADCRVICEMPTEHIPILDTSRSIYPTYTQLMQSLRYKGASFRRALEHLTVPRTTPSKFPVNFWLETYKDLDGSGKVQNYLNGVYNPLYEQYFNESSDETALSIRLSALFSPMSDVQTLDEKINCQQDVYPLTQHRFQVPFKQLFTRLLAPHAVHQHSFSLVNCHYYFMVLNSRFDESLDPLEVASTQINRAGELALIEALCMTDICIAQQTLLSGDAFLADIYRIKKELMEQGSGASPALIKKNAVIEKLFQSNSILAQNYILYGLRTDVEAKSSSFASYQVALGIKDDDYLLRQVAVLDWNFIKPGYVPAVGEPKKPPGWTIKLGERFFAIPNGEQLLGGKLLFQPVLHQLLDIRKRLLEEIATYELLTDTLSDEKRQRFNSLILNCM